jgi:hypothetical protein
MFWSKKKPLTYEQEMDLAVEHVTSIVFTSLRDEGVPQHIGWDDLGRTLIARAREEASR